MGSEPVHSAFGDTWNDDVVRGRDLVGSRGGDSSCCRGGVGFRGRIAGMGLGWARAGYRSCRALRLGVVGLRDRISVDLVGFVFCCVGVG